jgi:dihydrofolate reductase
MSSIRINAIAAMCDANRGIGLNGVLPWSIPDEYQYFLNVIQRVENSNKTNLMIMGRVSWTEFIHKTQTIPNLLYVVISNTLTNDDLELYDKISRDSVFVVKSYDAAIKLGFNELNEKIESIFVLGGIAIYKEAFLYEKFDLLYLTHVYGEFKCDRFLEPDNFLDLFENQENFSDFSTRGYEIGALNKDPKNDTQYTFKVYKRKY